MAFNILGLCWPMSLTFFCPNDHFSNDISKSFQPRFPVNRDMKQPLAVR